MAHQGRSAFRLAHRGDGYWAEYPDLPEAVIAYDEADVLAAFGERRLSIVNRFGGEWSHMPVQSQDVMVARKD